MKDCSAICAALDTTRAQQLAVLENNEALIAGWLSELDDLRDERVTLHDQTNTAIGDNQVYRMAQLFSGVDSAADTPPAYVVRIAAIWFGSLAAMVAFTGVVLALASNVILDPRGQILMELEGHHSARACEISAQPEKSRCISEATRPETDYQRARG